MSNDSTNITSEALEDLDSQGPIDLIIQQAEQIDELREEVEKLKKANEYLREKRIPIHGHKEGHQASWRPIPDHIDHQVEVPLESCPQVETIELTRGAGGAPVVGISGPSIC